MKKQVFAIITYIIFFALPFGFCMEKENKDNEPQPLMQQVFETPELSRKILDYVYFRRPHYHYELPKFKLSEPMPLHRMVNSMPKSYFTNINVDHVWSKFGRENNRCGDNWSKQFYEFFTNKSINELQIFLNETDSMDPSVPDKQLLQPTQFVSKWFCDVSRSHITSIIVPSWATDEDLKEYIGTLSNLNRLIIKSFSDEYIPTGKPVGSMGTPSITDEGLQKLTMLTALSLKRGVGITDNGFKTLTNLTSLDLDDYWDMTDDGLIDERDQPRHLKLKLLLLPNKHEITDKAIEILEKQGVTVKESEYSV